MDWDQLKDMKGIGAIVTAIAAVFTFIIKIVSTKADADLKRAEIRKINQEIKAAEKKEIEQLKLELKRIKLELNKTSRMIDKIIKML